MLARLVSSAYLDDGTGSLLTISAMCMPPRAHFASPGSRLRPSSFFRQVSSFDAGLQVDHTRLAFADEGVLLGVAPA